MPNSISDLSETMLVTHQGCLDGCGCAIAFLHAGGKFENIRFVPAGSANRFIDEDDCIRNEVPLLFADVYMDNDHADTLEKRGDVMVLDHHNTARHLSRRRWCVIDASRCATQLTMDHLEVYSVGDLAKIIADHDLGVFEDERSDDMSMLMNFLGQEDFVKRMVVGLGGRVGDEFWTEWEAKVIDVLRHNREKIVETACSRITIKKLTTPDGRIVKIGYVVSSNPNVSYMLSHVLRSFPDVSVAAKIDIDRSIVSLRSKGDVDVSEVAKMYGGGGHKRAAGYRLRPYFLGTIIDEVHNV